MTCAKVRVFAIILTSDGKMYTGSNDCLDRQLVCPREPGSDYSLCVSVCRQPGHAEVMAITKARNNGSPIRHGKLFVFGNTPCVGCMELMTQNAISWEAIP